MTVFVGVRVNNALTGAFSCHEKTIIKASVEVSEVPPNYETLIYQHCL